MEFEIGMPDDFAIPRRREIRGLLEDAAGRLRSELAWENLRCFLPHDAAKHRALDVGGGTGFASVQLARLGYEVVLLDGSEQMLRIARRGRGRMRGDVANFFLPRRHRAIARTLRG